MLHSWLQTYLSQLCSTQVARSLLLDKVYSGTRGFLVPQTEQHLTAKSESQSTHEGNRTLYQTMLQTKADQFLNAHLENQSYILWEN